MVKTAVIIPTFNEEKTIAKVIQDFKKELPKARIVVANNKSTDNTQAEAEKAGAEVIFIRKQGKGFTLREALDVIDADIYVIVDGDGTYPAQDVHQLIRPVLENKCDMAVGTRLEYPGKGAITPLHYCGNKTIVSTVNLFFRTQLTDILSGYRVLHKNLVSKLNLTSAGFEIETELTIQTLIRQDRIMEIPIHYAQRVKGSESKLSTFSDGFLILFTIIAIMRDLRPMLFFSLPSLFLILTGAGGIAVASLNLVAFTQSTKLIIIILSVASLLSGTQLLSMGFILHSIRGQYLSIENILKKKPRE